MLVLILKAHTKINPTILSSVVLSKPPQQPCRCCGVCGCWPLCGLVPGSPDRPPTYLWPPFPSWVVCGGRTGNLATGNRPMRRSAGRGWSEGQVDNIDGKLESHVFACKQCFTVSNMCHYTCCTVNGRVESLFMSVSISLTCAGMQR